jgi:hypothetical protein
LGRDNLVGVDVVAHDEDRARKHGLHGIRMASEATVFNQIMGRERAWREAHGGAAKN